MCPLCAIDRILGTIAPASRNTHTTPEPFPASDEQPHTLNPQYQDFLSRNPEYARELDARKGEDAAEVDAIIRSDPRVK